jgi:SRSO17 transposase
MELVPSFTILLQVISPVMTAPTFDNFSTLMTGWIFAQRRTVTGMIVAAGAVGVKHHSSFHRVFASARWSRDTMGLAVFGLILPWIDNVVYLAVDDTLARKRGLKVFGTSMHHDPLLSSRKKKIMNWAHNWVVLGVLVRFPLWPTRAFCLPILFRLYLGKKRAKQHRRKYRSRPELVVEMLHLLRKHGRNRQFHLIADSSYGGTSVRARLPEQCDLTSRAVIDARLYEAPPVPKVGQKGRPRKRGQKLPTPKEMLAQRCRRVSLEIYGRTEQARLADVCARMFTTPDRPLRVVAIESTKGGRGQEVFYSTCQDATAEEILTWYSMRWAIEVTFHDSKQYLGFEQPQGWTRQAVERTAPMAMLLYSLIVLWFVQKGHRQYRPIDRPWYTSKTTASFADMLATLRRLSIRRVISSMALTGRGSRKVKRLLENAVSMAA